MPKFYNPRPKRKITNKSFGKIRKPANHNLDIREGRLETSVWGNNIGTKKRFYNNYLYSDLVNNFPSKNKKPKILVIGAGIGEELIELKNHLYAKKINPKIETMGITKMLSNKAKKVVHKDYSINLNLEEIDIKNPAHKKLIETLRNNYDVVAAPMSVGIHTSYIAYNCFLCSLMLKPNGVAKIQLLSDSVIKNYLENNKHYINERPFDFTKSELKVEKSKLRQLQRNYAQTQRLIPTVYRMLESYLGKGVAKSYMIEIKPDISNPGYNILEITRKKWGEIWIK